VKGEPLDELSMELFLVAGVGTELKDLLAKLRIKSDGCGGCSDHAAIMDTRGLGWCEDNIDLIVRWMRDEATRRGWWMYSDIIAKQLVKRAIVNASADLPSPDRLLEGTRHFLYHLGAFAATDTWRRNVEQVKKRLWLFNGRRAVAIATGPTMVDPDQVIEAFDGQIDQFFRIPNNPKLREVATFVPLLSEVEGYASDITFYAHAKGVTRPVNPGVTVHTWTDLMYETCLDYFPRVHRLLQSYPMAGSFKKVGKCFTGSRSTWHYSGTYYWFRNKDVFSKQWRKIDMQWWGTESWPGVMFPQNEAGCIFHDGPFPGLDLYSMEYLKGTVMPAYQAWKVEHQHERMEGVSA
jgi:hypothetical protein